MWTLFDTMANANTVVVESLQKQCYFYTYQNSCFIP